MTSKHEGGSHEEQRRREKRETKNGEWRQEKGRAGDLAGVGWVRSGN